MEDSAGNLECYRDFVEFWVIFECFLSSCWFLAFWLFESFLKSVIPCSGVKFIDSLCFLLHKRDAKSYPDEWMCRSHQ